MFPSGAPCATVDRVASFLVETYLAPQPSALSEGVRRARRAAEVGDGVAYLRSTYVPADETCLHLFEAVSAGALTRAAEIADLGHLRVVEVVESGTPASEETPA